MSLRHGLQTIVRVVRRRIQHQVQQHAHGHAGRQKPDIATSNPAQHCYSSCNPTGQNAVVGPNSQNLANKAARIWRLTPSSWSRFTQANGTRTVPASRPVLPLLLGFAGIGLVNGDSSSMSNLRGDGEGPAARNGIDLDTAIQVVQSVFKHRDMRPDRRGHHMDDPFTGFPSKLSGYALSENILAKGTEGAVFAAKKQCIVPSPEQDEQLADPCSSDEPMNCDHQGNGGHGEQRNKELSICDDKECNLALKMMFNYNVGCTPEEIMAEFEAEQLPLVLAGGTFCQSNMCKHRSLCSHHPNIVLMHHAFVDDVRVPSLSSAVSMFDMALPARLNPSGAGADTTMYIVMKRYRTSLRDYLTMKCGLSDRAVMVIVAQLLEAISYLGNCGVVHRDLKSNNILVDYEEGPDEAPHVVIADFGCAFSLRGRNLQDPVNIDDLSRQGNIALMAPEVKTAYHQNCLRYHDYLKADAWAVGAIMYEVCGQRNPFYSEQMNSSGYGAGDLPQLQSQVVGLRIVSELLLQKNPKDRASAQVAANILHLFLWQPSVSSLIRLCHGKSSVDSELSAWIIKVSLMQLLQNQAERKRPLTWEDPGIPRNLVERDLVETFLKRVSSDSLINATKRLIEALQPLVSAEFGELLSPSMEMEQLVYDSSNMNILTLQA